MRGLVWSLRENQCISQYILRFFDLRRLFAVGRSRPRQAAAHSTGEHCLENIFTIAIVLLAIAQALTIILTLRREGDIRELGKLADEQRLQIAQLAAWLAGRNAAGPPRRAKSEHGPAGEPIAKTTNLSEPTTTPKDPAQTVPTREDEAAQAIEIINWQREIIASLRAGSKGTELPQPTTSKLPPRERLG
jgi:hypothetical protein